MEPKLSGDFDAPLDVENNFLGAENNNGKKNKKGGTITFILFMLTIFTIKSSFFDISRVADNHMLPNISRDNVVFVNKTEFSIKLPFTQIVLFETGKPKRGDVVLHKLDWAEGRMFINRVVGLPGERVNYNLETKQVTINGEVITKKLTEQSRAHLDIFTEVYRGMEVYVLDSSLKTRWDDDDWLVNGEQTIPDGMYFVMSDDRAFCCDSRHWGLINHDDLIGKASKAGFDLPAMFSGGSGTAVPPILRKLKL